MPPRRKPMQMPLRYPTWGGKRTGAGRPRRTRRPLVPHQRRTRVPGRFPLHITITVCGHVPDLRGRFVLPLIEAVLARYSDKDGFRIVHYSVQGNHIHLIVEAPGGRDAVARAMKAIKVSIARRLNKLTFSEGTVWADRYHDSILDKPRKVRNALGYVLNNGRRHRVRGAWRRHRDRVDPCSSAEVFEGWKWPVRRERDGPPPVAPPGTWLLQTGWKRAGGLLTPDHVPDSG